MYKDSILRKNFEILFDFEWKSWRIIGISHCRSSAFAPIFNPWMESWCTRVFCLRVEFFSSRILDIQPEKRNAMKISLEGFRSATPANFESANARAAARRRNTGSSCKRVENGPIYVNYGTWCRTPAGGYRGSESWPGRRLTPSNRYCLCKISNYARPAIMYRVLQTYRFQSVP